MGLAVLRAVAFARKHAEQQNVARRQGVIRAVDRVRHMRAQVDDFSLLERETLATALELEGPVEALHGDRVGRLVSRQRLARAEIEDDKVRAVALQQSLDPWPRVVWPRSNGVDRLDAGGAVDRACRVCSTKHFGAVDGEVIFWLRHR